MNIVLGSSHEALTEFTWENVPEFAVITGPNGVGKTKLLKLLANGPQGTSHAKLRIGGESRPNGLAAAYVDSRVLDLKDPKPVTIDKLQHDIDHLWKVYNAGVHRADRLAAQARAMLARVFAEVQKAGHVPESLSREQFLDVALKYMQPGDETDKYGLLVGHLFTERVQFRFASYALRWTERIVALHRGQDANNVSEEEPPWNILNRFLQAAALPFQVLDPLMSGWTTPYVLRLLDQRTGSERKFSELSSGERILVAVCFWLFNLADTTVGIAHLLLDEPDAHLHPARTGGLISTLCNSVVSAHGIRVIMTTHRPTTVALAPAGSVFEMRSDPTRIIPVSSAGEVIRLLTASKVDVGLAQRVVLVEDDDDAKFYASAFRSLILAEYIRDDVNLVFVSCGRKRSSDSSGGFREVLKWVERLQPSKMRGIVDRDNGSPRQVAGVAVLPRYSIENYLIDPIAVVAALIDSDQVPEAWRVSIPSMQSHVLQSADADERQRLADLLLRTLREKGGVEDVDRTPIEYCDGVTIYYPSWINTARGKDLLRSISGVFDPRVINPKSLREAFSRIGLVPTCLRDLLVEVQSDP